AYAIKFTGALLPYVGHDVPVDIIVSTHSDRAGVFKQRTYFFPGKKPFTFNSRMLMGGNGELLEYVGAGLGMKIRIEAKDGNLHFRDDGYFIELFGRRISLPRFLSPGNTYLVHKDMGEKKFHIMIDISHPLYGRT